jgi:hypothetical protein
MSAGRIRRILPDIWTDSKVHLLSDQEALAWIALWSRIVDDLGRAKVEPVEFSLMVPRFTPKQWETSVLKFQAVGMVLVYMEGKKYLWIPNFEEIQKVRSPTPSLHPPPPDYVDVELHELRDTSEEEPPDETPYEHIVELWNDICGDLCPMVKKVDKERRTYIKRTWDGKKSHRDMKWWKELFDRVAASDFLTNRDGKGTFRAPFQWCLMPKNLVKILEGNYDNPRGGGPSGGKMNKKNEKALAEFAGKEAG